MATAHVAHDCNIGDDVTMANAVLLAGHVTIGERAFLGGAFSLHQFCRIGRLAIVAGNEALNQDVPPFAAVRYGGLKGYNAVGCRRAKIAAESLTAIRACYYRMRRMRNLHAAVQSIREEVPQVPEVVELVDFITSSKRGIVEAREPRRITPAATTDDG
jgi:UDP-N-acetylglucosamine acyltransferase